MGSQISSAILIMTVLAISQFGSASVMGGTTGTASTTFQKPAFNFDFSSLSDRNSAENRMTGLRNSWGDFFTARTKPVFSDTLTNVVKGSGNELRGTQN